MRKIISQGPNTVMEGVFSSPFVAPSLRSRALRGRDHNKVRKARRLQYRKKTLAVLMIVLTSTPLFAASPGQADNQSRMVVQRSENVLSVGRSDALKRPRYGAQKPDTSARAHSKRVQLDDYQRVPKAVTKERSTETVWLGQKNKSR